MTTLWPRTQLHLNYPIIQIDLDRHVYPYPLALITEEIISMTDSCDPYTMLLDESMDKFDREEFVKSMQKLF